MPLNTGKWLRSKVVLPELHQLEVFLKVVETHSFAGAARSMGRSQPAVSQAVARLEEIYGGDLFVRRRGTSLQLTPIGEAILPSVRTVLETINQQMARAALVAQSRVGNITLGFCPGLLGGPLRAGIGDFIIRSPQVRLRWVEALPGELHRPLNERAIDLMVVALMPKLESKTLVQEHLWDERLVIALPANHALAQKTALSWREIAGLPIILRAQPKNEVERFQRLVLPCGLERPQELTWAGLKPLAVTMPEAGCATQATAPTGNGLSSAGC